MFESFGRGYRMVMASIKMGWQDKRLLLPSILTVLTNIFFGVVMGYFAVGEFKQGQHLIPEKAGEAANLLEGAKHQGASGLAGLTGLNGPLDPSGFGSDFGQLAHYVDTQAVLMFFGISAVWWLTNRFLEGVTTGLVYTHLTEGPGSGKFSDATKAVFLSLPAIIVLGLVTFVARRLTGWMRNRRSVGIFGFGFNFLAGVIEIFWTLAGHLILPAIVIEGTSFWGALKRADKIAQGNLLTIGLGEVGVDLICRVTSYIVYLGGLAGFGYAWYQHVNFLSPMFVLGALTWAVAVVFVTALSIYIRAAFYTCLYVWALDAETVAEAERIRVRPPGPLAQALA
ncbi:MAG: hypothetical protein K2Y22_13170 [Candidatus Obscuribacterales bacterium]|nr:hypothetical protein [Candidatus Obscuribacterales bacterium]